MTTFTVSTVPASTIPAGFTQVTAATRTSENKKEIPASERSRSILIPSLEVKDAPSRFHSLILDTLYSIAKQQLAALWKEQGAALKEVSASLWTVDALLLFYSREQESKRLSKETVKTWFAESKLAALLKSKNDEKLFKQWETRIHSLAAPVLDLSEKQCTVTIATIGKHEEDADSLIGQQIIRRLQARIDALNKQVAEAAELEEI